MAQFHLKPELGTKCPLLARMWVKSKIFFGILQFCLCLSIIKSNNATLFQQITLFERFLDVVYECNVNVHYIHHQLTCTLKFPIDVLQVKAIMALADVTPKCVDALTETGTNRMTRGAFIHICETNTPIHHFSTLFQYILTLVLITLKSILI